MMSSGNSNTSAKPPPPPPPPPRPIPEDNKGAGGRKAAYLKQQEQGLKCPRCDSSNTKFCYYNNYSLSQPRHFCKTCRRYWTKGGALRNVPIGGGCRKNKKMKSNSRLSGNNSKGSSITTTLSSSSECSSLKFYQYGISPSMEFQLGGLPFPSLHSSITGALDQFASAPINPSCFDSALSVRSGSLMGFSNNYQVSSVPREAAESSLGFNGRIQDMGTAGSINFNSNFASSIESLGCINQDMHLKLQQQRLGDSFGHEENQKESSISTCVPACGAILDQITSSKPQPISFQNLDISKPVPNCVVNHPRTDWFFEINPYSTPTATGSATAKNITNYNSKGDGTNITSNWGGSQSWTGLNQYSTGFP